MRLYFSILLLFYSALSYGLEIKHVYHEPEMFLPNNGETVKIHFSISEESDVTVNIYDDRSILIRSIELPDLDKGNHFATWDGKEQAESLVPAEAYTYTITAKSETKETTHDFSDYTGSQKFKIDKVKWNIDKKQFEYTLNKPSRVFIRIGLDNRGPLLATVLNWVPRSSGKHIDKWNGKDASGALDLTKHPKLLIDMQSYELSKNTILVGPKVLHSDYLEAYPFGEKKRAGKVIHKKKMVVASQQAPETRGDYVAKLILPYDLKKNEKGVPIVKGVIPVVLDVDKEYRAIAIERRSEPVFYIDGQFSMENEVGYLPITWRVDTSALNEGEHYLTANLRGYEGNFGIATTKIYVKKE